MAPYAQILWITLLKTGQKGPARVAELRAPITSVTF